MTSGVLAFVAAMAVAPAVAAQPRPIPAAPAQVAPTTAQQLGVAVDYLMMLYAMQAMASGPPVPPAQAETMVREYFTNGAQATAVPTSGPAAAYFDNAGTALAQVTLDIGNRPTPTPEGGAAAPSPSAGPAATPTATASQTPTPTGAASATPTPTPSPTPTPTPTPTASPTPTPTGAASATPTVMPTAAAPGAPSPVTIVQPVTVPVPTPAAPVEPQAAVPRPSGAAWAGVFAAGAALGALLVAIGAWLRPPRRTAS